MPIQSGLIVLEVHNNRSCPETYKYQKGAVTSMIQQSAENENTQDELNTGFIAAIREMKISKLLHDTNIRKDTRTLSGEVSGEKRTAFEIFQFLLLMVFQGCNLYRFLGSKKQDIAQRVPISAF